MRLRNDDAVMRSTANSLGRSERVDPAYSVIGLGCANPSFIHPGKIALKQKLASKTEWSRTAMDNQATAIWGNTTTAPLPRRLSK